MRRFNSNISSLFGNSSASNSLFGSFATRKNGSYSKLLKSYYADQKNRAAEEKKAKDTLSALKGKKELDVVKPGLNQVKKESDGLKVAAEALDKEELWKQENGEYDLGKITDAIKNFANEYNDVINQAAKTGSKDVQLTTRYMTNLTSAMSKALAKVGVNVAKDGKISIDEEMMKKSDVKNIKSLFAGKTSYGSQVAAKAQEISRDTILDSGVYSGDGYYSNSISNIFNKWI